MSTALPVIVRFAVVASMVVALASNLPAPSAAASTPQVASTDAAPTSDPAFDLDQFDSTGLAATARDEFSNTFSVAGGQHVTEISADPVNIRRADGSWVGVKTAVAEDAAGDWAVADNPLSPKFADNADESGVLQLKDGDYSLGFTLDDADSSSFARSVKPTPTSPRSDVVYSDVQPGVDLAYDVNPASVKETLVLDTEPSDGQSSWTWDVHAPNLRLTKDSFGDLHFVDPSGATRFTIPAPSMWDSSKIDGVQEAAEEMIDTSFVHLSSGDWALTLSADEAWLTDASRVYPVYVDPTTLRGDSNFKAYRSDGNISSDSVRVGNSRGGGVDTFWRTMVYYDYASLFGKQIIGGKVSATVDSGDTATRSGSVNTSACTGYGCVGTKLGNLDIASYGDTVNEDVPAMISSWVNSQDAGHSLMLRGSEASGSYTYKTLTTRLQLVWKDFPNITGAASPSPTNGTVGPRTPTLSVSTSDPDGSGVILRYLVYGTAAANGTPVWQSPWIIAGATTVPAVAIMPGTTYWWKAQIRDSADQVYGTDTTRNSPTWSFITPADVSSTTSAPTAEPRFLTSTNDVVTTLFPLLGSLISGPAATSTTLRSEVWTASTGGQLVGYCEEPYAYVGQYASCTLSAPLANSTTYALRTQSSTASTPGAWSAWSGFSTMPASMATPPVIDSALVAGDPLIAGTILDAAGSPAPSGTIVDLMIEPSDDALDSAKLGEVLQVPIVASATVTSGGHYALRVADESQLAVAADTSGHLDVQIQTEGSGDIAELNGTIDLQPSTAQGGRYPGAYFTNDAGESGTTQASQAIVVRSTSVSTDSAGVFDNTASDPGILNADSGASKPDASDLDFTTMHATDGDGDATPTVRTEASVIATDSVSSGGTVAATGHGQDASCAAQVIARHKAPTMLSAFWDLTPSAKEDYFWGNGASSTLGVGISATGKYGSFTAKGTSELRYGAGLTWHKPRLKEGYGAGINTRYVLTKYTCPQRNNAKPPKFFKEVPTGISGGQFRIWPGNTPKVTKDHCDPYDSGTTDITVSNGKTSTLEAGVDLGNAIGLSLSSRTEYTSDSSLRFFSTNADVWLCGTKGGLVEASAGEKVGLWVVKPGNAYSR